MRDGATPWRRSSARSACSSGARLRPLMRAPRLSRPSQVKETSRLPALTVAVAAGAMGYCRPVSLDRDTVDFLKAGHAVLDLFESRAPQGPDAFPGGLIRNVGRASRSENDARDLLGHG